MLQILHSYSKPSKHWYSQHCSNIFDADSICGNIWTVNKDIERQIANEKEIVSCLWIICSNRTRNNFISGNKVSVFVQIAIKIIN